MNPFEFQVRLVYIVSSRTGRATGGEREGDSAKTNNKQPHHTTQSEQDTPFKRRLVKEGLSQGHTFEFLGPVSDSVLEWIKSCDLVTESVPRGGL